MGVASSSNVTNAVANVLNQVQNSTAADTTQYTECLNLYSFNRCPVIGNLNIDQTCTVQATATSILSQQANNNLNNNISQQLSQTAASVVGSLGLGYASANNTANVYAGSTNQIVNAVTSSVKQDAVFVTQFDCTDSPITGTINLGINNASTFLSDQVLNNSSTTQIVNNISQDITQKATATVEGIAAALIALAVLIVAIGWFIFRPLQLALGNKFIVIGLVVLLILIIVLVMYVQQLPPFFNPPEQCIIARAAIGGCDPSVDCISGTTQSVRLPQAPMRYAYNIIGQGDSTVDPDNEFVPGLLQMTISRNGGWTDAGYTYFEQNLVPLGLPNGLVQSGNSYVTDEPTWRTFLSDPQQAADARFYLARDLQIDTYARIFSGGAPGIPTEKCTINGVEHSDSTCYTFTPDTTPTNLLSAVTSGGTVTGAFGVCNTPLYRIQSGLKIGAVVLLGLFIVLMIFLAFFSSRGSTTNGTNKGESVKGSATAAEGKSVAA